MCGICGIIRPGESPPEDLLHAMARTMRHRGPDDEGFYCAPGVGLGFQRLSIIDLAGGHQPMSSSDERYHVVFNGEIYNFQSLRQTLGATGRHPFRTQSDTEVILHLYQEYGEDCVKHLRGMFALAIWDSQTKTLFMARDRFGKKPLVYAEVNGSLAFASELRALLKVPGIQKEIDYESLDLYLSLQYIPSPRTIYKQIRKLPPSHTLVWHQGKLRIQRYWELKFLPKTTLSFAEAKQAMMDKLREAVKLRMIADVPLGAFLSGGKDSSVIVGLMSELSSQPVKTFSIGFEEEKFSELPHARKVADHFHCDHREFMVKPDMVDILPKLAWHYGEPYADSSALPSYYVSKLTREHVTVALNGDGGDEILAGYPRYQAMKFMTAWQCLPLAFRSMLFRMASLVPDRPPPHSKAWRIKRLLSLGMSDPKATYLDTLNYFRQDEKPFFYSDFLKDQIQKSLASAYIGNILGSAKGLPGIDPYLYTDLQSYLPECLMVKMDIASMANSLETRSPFLDHEFAELVATFPDHWKLHGLTHSKYILDKAVQGWLPDSIIGRKKQGFAIPMSTWFRGKLNAYLRSMLLSDKATARGLFKKSAIERLIDDTASGKRDRSYGLWALLMLEHWHQVYID